MNECDFGVFGIIILNGAIRHHYFVVVRNVKIRNDRNQETLDEKVHVIRLNQDLQLVKVWRVPRRKIL